MKKLIILIILPITVIALSFVRLSDIEGAKKILIHNNLKPIELKASTYPTGGFESSKGDIYVTEFKAISQNGDTVSGYVTKGIYKGSTIRFKD